MFATEIGRYRCPSCGVENEAVVDPSGGSEQHYVEDCETCCRPNVLHIRIVPDPVRFTIVAESES